MSKAKILVVFILTFFVCFVSFGLDDLQKTKGSKESERNLYKNLELFGDAITIIQSNYVEDITPQKLIYGALEGLLSSLDMHSQFLDPEAYEEIKIETEGEFGGLGIVITIRDKILTVVSPIEGTPAHEAGLESGDMIVEIDGKSTKDISLTKAVKKLRGKPGTEVNVTVLRENAEDKILKFNITRDIVKIKSVKKAKVLDDNIGYVRVIDFQEDTAKALESKIKELSKKGIKGLILDLRNNPGGLLDIAVDVSQIFIPEEKVIVTTKGRVDSQNLEFVSKSSYKYNKYPLVVLVNQGSASGSEIVAGAIQDYNLGILLGKKTFGKGSVQTVIPLSDNSAIRLTTSKYFTPSGRSIHHKGIDPDIEVKYRKIENSNKTTEAKEKDVFKQLEQKDVSEDKKEEKTEKAEKKKDEFQYDSQLMRAIDLLKGIRIYNKAKINNGN